MPIRTRVIVSSIRLFMVKASCVFPRGEGLKKSNLHYPVLLIFFLVLRDKNELEK